MNTAATTEPTRCRRCHRPLRNTSPDGYGPTCRRRIRRAADQIEGYKPHQMTSARELIDDGAILPLPDSAFVAVSSDGTDTYVTDAHSCTCPAGEAGRVCYHTAAARMLLAA